MVYHVIGLMSGSSLDGLDICYAQYEEIRGKWSAQILASECIAYSEEWQRNLQSATTMAVPDFLRLHTAYGRYTGERVRDFIGRNDLEHRVHFVASHGHTVMHDPLAKTSFQLGDGASVAATLGLPVISDLRAMDVALGGQGAPIVPIGDKLLFGDYALLLNLGGIANITLNEGQRLAFDICVANQALNAVAAKAGLPYDEGGKLAASGTLVSSVWDTLCAYDYYSAEAPKSLSNEQAMEMVAAFTDSNDYSIEDRLHTLVQLIAAQITAAVTRILPDTDIPRRMLVTGGGAFNEYLISVLQHQLAPLRVTVGIPDAAVAQNKEALVMGLIGILRWREEANVEAATTGASRNSIGGAYWMGA
ncbi:MAG: anhydro-N-acetylmuramic acid kinase [Chitinophagaceae bacterium]